VALKYSRTADGRVTVPLNDLGERFELTAEYAGEIDGPRGGAFDGALDSEFLAEGFATYSQALWCEHKRGPDGLREAMREQAELALLASLEPGNEKSCFESESGPLLYEKGAWVLHMLRHQVGDTVWFKTVREFAEDNAGEVVICKQFQDAFEEAYGKPLDWFFDQWLYGTGAPWVIGEVEAEDGGQARVKLRQRLVTGEGDTDSLDLEEVWETAPSEFTLRIDLLVKLRRGEMSQTVTMNLPEQDFIFNAGGEPTGLVIDPDCWLLNHSKRQLTAASDSQQQRTAAYGDGQRQRPRCATTAVMQESEGRAAQWSALSASPRRGGH